MRAEVILRLVLLVEFFAAAIMYAAAQGGM